MNEIIKTMNEQFNNGITIKKRSNEIMSYIIHEFISVADDKISCRCISADLGEKEHEIKVITIPFNVCIFGNETFLKIDDRYYPLNKNTKFHDLFE